MKGRLLLDVVVRESSTILKLLSGEDETLLIRGNALLILDLGFDIVDRVRRLDLKGDGLARKGCVWQEENVSPCFQPFNAGDQNELLTKICISS